MSTWVFIVSFVGAFVLSFLLSWVIIGRSLGCGRFGGSFR